MPEESSNSHDIVSRNFTEALKQHGYAFQYSAIRIADELFSNTHFENWIFLASEYPVEIAMKNRGTRIDFILKAQRYPVYLLFECKRANPALKNWCFAHAPYTHRDHYEDNFIVEKVEYIEGNFLSKGVKLKNLNKNESYHVALEIKSPEKGDKAGGGRDEIEQAATQVCSGLNGFVETSCKYPVSTQSLFLIPVILTTANIWVSQVDLGKANMKTGELETTADIEVKPWVYFQYNQSPGLKHPFTKITADKDEIKSILISEYVRTIPIVAGSSLSEFLMSFNPRDFNLS